MIQRYIYIYNTETDLNFKMTFSTLEVIVSVDVAVEDGPGGGREGAEVAPVLDALLVSWQRELVLCVLALLLQVTIGSGDKTVGLGLGFLSIKYRIVQDLQNYRVVNPQYCCGLW